jgi:DNA-binding beta-propeller fold protein YncE
MHAFPQLRKLEDKYRNEMAVVGVHSAKFTQEKAVDNVRQAVLRYDIGHPVVNDSDFDVWRRWGVRAWPTFMFVGPDGTVLGKHEGEFDVDALDGAIANIIADFDGRGLIDRTPLHFELERDKMAYGPLSFPGKLLGHEPSNTLVIADSNHHRLVIAGLGGEVRAVVGSGEPGLADGEFGSAKFNDPQGLALDGDILYVADTKNHAIRRVDLTDRSVETLAGTGEPAPTFSRGGLGRTTPIKSPWDVTLVPDGPDGPDGRDREVLYIAMAGFHQLWRLDLISGHIEPHAGTGQENIVDGLLDTAQLAQPSGIVSDGSKLYFADSETSAIRTADMDPKGVVSTIVGEDLFTFGDVDGTGTSARFQHPIGVDLAGGFLYLTDTYNNKVKRIELVTGQVTTLFGTGEPGLRDGDGLQAMFAEPGGLSVAGNRMFIADTNNHAIRVADLVSGVVSTLSVKP